MKERFAYRNRNQDSYLKLLVFFFFFICSYSFSQFKPITPHAEISILTIASGASLNDAFGHSAYRINDSIAKVDVIFDYGRYDFNTPNFYLKFAQGKLNYKIGANHFSDFYQSYVAQNRQVTEQILNLNFEEKEKGSVEVGKFADFIIMDKNIMELSSNYFYPFLRFGIDFFLLL